MVSFGSLQSVVLMLCHSRLAPDFVSGERHKPCRYGISATGNLLDIQPFGFQPQRILVSGEALRCMFRRLLMDASDGPASLSREISFSSASGYLWEGVSTSSARREEALERLPAGFAGRHTCRAVDRDQQVQRSAAVQGSLLPKLLLSPL